MRVVKPVQITDAMLISSSVAENEYPAYNPATAYAVDVYCIYNHRIYKSLQANNLGHQPDLYTSGLTPWWLDTTATNRWRMLDNRVGTATTAANEIVVVLAPGRINTIGLLQLIGRTVTASMTANGAVVWSKTVNLYHGTGITGWYQYFFGEHDFLSELVLTDIPPYNSGVITITISGGNEVACGMLVVGMDRQLGFTQYGPSIGISDYSAKSVDDFGQLTLIQRDYAKTQQLVFDLDNNSINRVQRTLEQYRSTLCLWIGVDAFYTQLAVFGLYNNFRLQIPYFNSSTCSLEIEGVI